MDPGFGRYIYGIIRNSEPVNFGQFGIGSNSDHVYTVIFKNISAVVSSSPIVRYEARRVNMIAHQKVLEEVMKQFSVLPVRFSTISPHDNDEAIINILKDDYQRFDNLLIKMNKKKEMGLKVMASEQPVYESIIQKHDNIRRLRDKLVDKPFDKTHKERIKIGEMVFSALKDEIEIYKDYILGKLSPIAEDVKVNDNYGNFMVLNAAFLINEEKEPLFDNEVNQIDQKYEGLMTIKYVGTLPPYNFVNLSIKTLGV